MTIILGLDPGLVHTGWGIIRKLNNKNQYLGCGVISPSVKLSMAERLLVISQELTKIIEIYNPTVAALEETFVNKNPITSLKLGQARGAIFLTLALSKIIVYEYAAKLVKKTVVGVGSAEKNQVMAMVKILLPIAKIDSLDAADALGVAICHASHEDLIKRKKIE